MLRKARFIPDKFNVLEKWSAINTEEYARRVLAYPQDAEVFATMIDGFKEKEAEPLPITFECYWYPDGTATSLERCPFPVEFLWDEDTFNPQETQDFEVTNMLGCFARYIPTAGMLPPYPVILMPQEFYSEFPHQNYEFPFVIRPRILWSPYPWHGEPFIRVSNPSLYPHIIEYQELNLITATGYKTIVGPFNYSDYGLNMGQTMIVGFLNDFGGPLPTFSCDYYIPTDTDRISYGYTELHYNNQYGYNSPLEFYFGYSTGIFINAPDPIDAETLKSNDVYTIYSYLADYPVIYILQPGGN